MSDRAMMEEVLELLAADSPDPTRVSSTNASTTASTTTDNNHSSSVTELSISGTNNDKEGVLRIMETKKRDVTVSGTDNENESGDNGMHSNVETSAEDNGDQEARRPPNDETSSSNPESFEEKYPPGHKALQIQAAVQQQGADAALGLAQHMQNSINSPVPSFCGGAPDVIPSAATADIPSPSPTLPVQPQVEDPMNQRSMTAKIPHEAGSPHEEPGAPPPSTTSSVLPTGQKVKVLNSIEFDDLRRKLRMQTASRRYRKRKKEESRRQKKQIQELQAELARLQDLESQTKQYQLRSIESLEEELKIHQSEITDLSGKLQDAAKVERDWINLMSNHQRKFNILVSDNDKIETRTSDNSGKLLEVVHYYPGNTIQELLSTVDSDETQDDTNSTMPSTSHDTNSELNSTNQSEIGQHVHVLTDTELADLRRRLQIQTASLRHDRQEKEEIRRQKLQIRELKAELSRLQQVEAELEQYEQRSIESLETELQTHQQEVADLAIQLQNAANEELEWVL
ncbi:hypothetical protein PHMEG_00010920 [Phytophthora megakarya]|uniref:BZIP domain-containing protein n=1 Tax=Phytophthora megakarya TaxID=4795 RepID=A0A225WCH9_9STRA|nr:hypothetical protein PHMEG_00010920 [Phytophthora megakarya]